MTDRLVFVCLAALGGAIPSGRTHAASIIDTTTSWNGTSAIGNLGAGFYRAMGQTFRVDTENTVLEEFSLFVDGGSAPLSPLSFSAFVMGWNGSSATEPVLFQSSVQSSSRALERVTFSTGSIALVPGREYVMFIDTAGDSDSFGLLGITSGINAYADGQFVAATNFQNLTGDDWHISPSGVDQITGAESDAAFVARFSNVIPEPFTVFFTATFLGLMVARQYLKTVRSRHQRLSKPNRAHGHVSVPLAPPVLAGEWSSNVRRRRCRTVDHPPVGSGGPTGQSRGR